MFHHHRAGMRPRVYIPKEFHHNCGLNEKQQTRIHLTHSRDDDKSLSFLLKVDETWVYKATHLAKHQILCGSRLKGWCPSFPTVHLGNRHPTPPGQLSKCCGMTEHSKVVKLRVDVDQFPIFWETYISISNVFIKVSLSLLSISCSDPVSEPTTVNY